MRNVVLALAFVLGLGGCTKAVTAVSHGIQTDAEFNQIFLEDVQQAIILARTTNDTIALKCWVYLEKFALDNAPEETTAVGEVKGALGLYQKARNVRRTVIEVKISDEFRLECGPMLIESMGVLGRLGIRIAL